MLAHRFLILVLALAAWPAWATVIATYPDPVTFNNATNSLYSFTNITFESDTCFLCTSLTDSGVTFIGTGDSGPLTVGPVSGWASGNVLKRSTGGGSILATLPNNILAFSVYLVTVSASFPTPFDITFTSGSSYDYSVTLPQTVGGSLFFGVTADAPITNLTFLNGFQSLTVGIDNLDIGSGGGPPPATPEAATFLLIGSGLMFMRLLRRRERNQPARRGAVSTIFTGIIRALSRVLPENTTSASAPRCVSTR